MNGLLSGQKSITGPVTLPKSDAVYEISSALSYRMTRRSKGTPGLAGGGSAAVSVQSTVEG